MKLLIIDTDKQHAQAARKILQSCGHRVNLAFSVDTAILKLQMNPYDLIFIDLELEVQSVDELFTFLQRHHPELPIIGMVSKPSIAKAFRALKQRATDVILKPLNLSKTVLLSTLPDDSVRTDRIPLKPYQEKNLQAILIESVPSWQS